MEIEKLKGILMPYAWGDKSYLQNLIGVKEGETKGEYWLGTHKRAPAVIEKEGESLIKYLKENKGITEKDGELKFLFKILAIDRPLSLQVHPNKEQAEKGWREEKEKRERGDECNYTDDNSKAEVIVALTPLKALLGFRKEEEFFLSISKYAPTFFSLIKEKNLGIKDTVIELLNLSGDKKEKIINEIKKNLDNCSKEEKEKLDVKTSIYIFSLYPDDIGSFFPLLMNVVEIEKGEALYLEAGVMHAYLLGCGVEVMENSDNVLRGGLTEKRIDKKELLKIMKDGSFTVNVLRPIEKKNDIAKYNIDNNSFTLYQINEGEKEHFFDKAGVVMVLDGKLELERENCKKTILKKGESAFIPKLNEKVKINSKGLSYLAEEK